MDTSKKRVIDYFNTWEHCQKENQNENIEESKEELKSIQDTANKREDAAQHEQEKNPNKKEIENLLTTHLQEYNKEFQMEKVC